MFWANSSAVEHLPYKQGVTGSSPVSPTICFVPIILFFVGFLGSSVGRAHDC